MQVYIQSKTKGITNEIRTIDSNNNIVLCGNFEPNKGIGTKLLENGTLSWGYIFQNP